MCGSQVDDGGQNIQTSNYKINKSWGCNVHTAWCLQLIILYYIFESCYKNKSLKLSSQEKFFVTVHDDGQMLTRFTVAIISLYCTLYCTPETNMMSYVNNTLIKMHAPKIIPIYTNTCR